MRDAGDDQTLASLLPGTWTVAATNFPMWLGGDRTDPQFTYTLISPDPLVLGDDVSFTKKTGERGHVRGVDRLQGDTFVWRGRGLLRVAASHWSVVGVSDDASIVVLRFARTLFTPAGIDVIVRDGSGQPELRAKIARGATEFGLSPEDFASLTWLAPSRQA
ncbi:hypothetical protein [Glaciihabitans sp. dw_435]|uniref:hypothetical protein n=1 Tax=Glaciihabitans sp. dw_435 TaxID=2720081 RepID=UPI001BD67B3C|nr:hypothetical protein [Glaciihabitans sp. dw_435]